MGKAEKTKEPKTSSKPQITGEDLLNSGLIGMWENRKEIGDTLKFARKLREKACKSVIPKEQS